MRDVRQIDSDAQHSPSDTQKRAFIVRAVKFRRRRIEVCETNDCMVERVEDGERSREVIQLLGEWQVYMLVRQNKTPDGRCSPLVWNIDDHIHALTLTYAQVR